MPDLPTGTITFLFTDIEGSTPLLERLGERYRDVQERHNAIVRAAIGEGNGREMRSPWRFRAFVRRRLFDPL